MKVSVQLLPFLPVTERYRVVFMERPLGEVIDSQSAMLERLGNPDDPARKQHLAQTYVEQLARIQHLLTARGEHCKLLAVDYHRALTDPQQVAHAINSFLGGSLNETKMIAAVAPNLRRQFGSQKRMS